ncbi:laccase, multicopper oxidase, benzenediol:oxygen oxidorectuctase [Paramarasmius palmivorus]|uniref:Laccase, multicopper oxidase, benzenediol:oxygen oxidorectuctase n=1 Tax=Paramarasmius palmivorus TaxID=297713 RepID=A0AAW0CHF8_9AGAR
MHGVFKVLSAFLFGHGCIAAIGPIANLVISNKDVSPDGFTRGAVVAGGSTIGPLIVGRKGDTFKLNVINKLNDNSMLQSTTIHWHGFFQKGTAWADGPAFVTQCPIAKGDSFLYDFRVPDQAGTFWYHSHLSTQYCDGLRGAIVVYDRFDPHRLLYDVDDESTVITLADWYHAKAKTLTFPYGPLGLPEMDVSDDVYRTPDSTLINGLGRWSQGGRTPLSVIKVHWGRRYRIRVANIACNPHYTFWIDNHDMTIIEVDSVNVRPKKADSFEIFVGIRANPNTGTTGFDNGINSAILHYIGAPNTEPAPSTFGPSDTMKESEIRPLLFAGAPGFPEPGKADVNINLNFGFNQFGKFTVNGVEYVNPTVPVLLQILSGAQRPNDLLPSGSVYQLPPNKVIEISMPGGLLGIEHPIHLHGHTFDVVRVAGSDQYNFLNPIRRDVVSIGNAGDNVTIRFRTDNPGPWFLHCHIDWHLEAGFAVVFAERTSEWRHDIDPSRAWDKLCPKFNSLGPEDL